MTLYCHIKDGHIDAGPRELPAIWYGWPLRELTEAKRQELGWLPSNALRGVRCRNPQIFADRVEYAIDLDGLRRQKLLEIALAYNAAEAQDFVSSALGEPYAYSTWGDARIDLLGAGMMGVDRSYSCTRLSDGIKASYPHTAAQMQQVLTEAAAWREGLILTLNARRAAIAEAATAAAILAITWED